MWNIKHKQEQTKQNKNTLTDTNNRTVVTRGEGKWGEGKLCKRVKYAVTEGNQTLGGEHTIEVSNTG